MESKKYPRTFHFPFSPGATNDDKMWSDQELEDQFVNQKIVFTEKLDGSNVCLTNTEVFARSHAGAPAHASFDALKKIHASIKNLIPNGISIFGEWLLAVHSIEYLILPHYLNLFGVRDDRSGAWWNWDDVVLMAMDLKLPTVPVLLIGQASDKENLQNYIKTLASLSSVYGLEREGIVVRQYYNVVDDQEKLIGVAKYVRANHVQTTEHWTRQKIKKQPVLNSY